jgi:endonuclease/exonuclease/phosphatase family metal-dependent hydrolase
VLRILTWNVNHRANKRRIQPWLAQCIVEQQPDIVVLTEYVVGSDHTMLIERLRTAGLDNVVTTTQTPRQNQVLVASRTELKQGPLSPPPIHPSVRPNYLHVTSPSQGLDVIGFRMPIGGDFDGRFRDQVWDWLLKSVELLGNHSAVLTGDFNCAPEDPAAKHGQWFRRLNELGWSRAVPSGGFSFGRFSNCERSIDHCFVSHFLKVAAAQYSWSFVSSQVEQQGGRPGNPDHAMLIVDVERVIPHLGDGVVLDAQE